MVIMALVVVVSDLEKITHRKPEPNSWSFQKKGWLIFATWCVAMPAVLAAGREVTSQYQEKQIRDMRDNSIRIEILENEIKELKAILPKQ